MSSPKPSRFEQAVSALLFVLLAVVGWAPFVASSWRDAFAAPDLLFMAAALGVMSLALIHDAAERLIGAGRGIYAIAVVCSFAPVGAVIGDSSILGIVALFFVASASVWFAARAEGSNRGFNLAMLAGALFIVGYLFSYFPGTIILLFAVWLAGAKGSSSPRKMSWLLLFYVAGTLLRSAWNMGVPMIVEIPAPASLPLFKALLLHLPWLLWLLSLIVLLLRRKPVAPWQPAALASLALLYIACYAAGMHPLVPGIVAAPVLALSVTDLAHRWFALRRRDSHFAFALPLLITAALLLFVAAVRIFKLEWIDMPSREQAVIALFLAAFAIALPLRNFARWSFAVSVLIGLLAGSLWWMRKPLLAESDPFVEPFEPSSSLLFQLLPILLIAFVAVIRRLYGRRMPRAAKQPGEYHLFAGANLRLFTHRRRKEWAGELADTAAKITGDHRFVIFGDVTGAEFPVTTRRGGYFVYRSLAREIRRQRADFAVCVGDLATAATEISYRRLRQILRHISVPLVVSPGNHDLFDEEEYTPQYFHSLFGADNCSFVIGSVRYVILNNAWGKLDEKQFAWLKDTLASNTSPVTFVFCHKPPIDPRAEQFYGMEDREWAARMHELFKQHRVTAVFSGHIHALLSHQRDGVTYVISGGGGSKLDAEEAVHHYLLSEVSSQAVVVRAYPIKSKGDAKAPLLELKFDIRS